jgi:hypothetical protein
MRIVPVTGDLPAVVAPPPAARTVCDPVPSAPPLAVTAAAPAQPDTDATSDRRGRPAPQPFFDPPLIAQRAVLGLPIGLLVADFARSQGIPFAAASAAVDRELPHEAG